MCKKDFTIIFRTNPKNKSRVQEQQVELCEIPRIGARNGEKAESR
jgi:hypothetical protein